MKHGYFIHFNARDTVGVSKKIDMQLEEFSKHFEVEEIDIKITNKNFFRNALSILPYFSICWDYTEAYEKIVDPDFIYIRKVGGDRKHFLFISHIKKKYPECKILVEIPTYPYFRESLQSITAVLLLKDYYNFRKMTYLIDRIVTYSPDEFIFNIPTIQIKNGINVSEIVKLQEIKEYRQNEIHLISVAVMKPHHGYERLLKGLSEYYSNGGKRNYMIHMIGGGPEKDKYEKMVSELKLQEHVIFYGPKHGKELDDLYLKADIAISALGFYKDGVHKSSALKVREYLSKGLPIISGCREDAFDNADKRYFCSFENDSSIIDFFIVEKFYDDIYKDNDRSSVIDDIREFAFEHVDNSVTMKPVIEYIEMD